MAKYLDLTGLSHLWAKVKSYVDTAVKAVSDRLVPATTTKEGFMSADDKKKLDGIEAGANKTVVDATVAENGTNPVSGKAVFDAIKASKDASDADYAAAIHNHAIADVTGLQDALDAKAPLASPTFTGVPKAPTAALTVNDTQIATTAFVQGLINDKMVAVADALLLKGVLGTGSNMVAALPDTHQVGWVYKVGTAGTYAGQPCEVGDMLVCVTAGTTAKDTDWTVLQNNLDIHSITNDEIDGIVA